MVSTSSDYRTVPLPTAAHLEAVDALYLAIAGGTTVTHSHLRIPPEAYRLSRRVRALIETGEPDGYVASERRLEDAVNLVREARDFTHLIVDLVGDTLGPLPAANEALELLEEYATGCNDADVALRAAIHDSMHPGA